MVISRHLKKFLLVALTFSALATPFQAQAGLWDTVSNWYTQCFNKNSAVTAVCTIAAGALLGWGVGNLVNYFRFHWIKKSSPNSQKQKPAPTSPRTAPASPKNAGAPKSTFEGILLTQVNRIDTLETELKALSDLVTSETASDIQRESRHLAPKLTSWRTKAMNIKYQIELLKVDSTIRNSNYKAKIQQIKTNVDVLIEKINSIEKENTHAQYIVLKAQKDKEEREIETRRKKHAAAAAQQQSDALRAPVNNLLASSGILDPIRDLETGNGLDRSTELTPPATPANSAAPISESTELPPSPADKIEEVD
jgi:hypothetical protein